MICRLCLNILSGEGIPLFSETENFEESKLIKTISKFMELQLTVDDAISTVVCKNCFDNLNGFSIFCEFVKKQQSCLLKEFLAVDKLNSQELLPVENVRIECNRLCAQTEEFAYANEIEEIKIEEVDSSDVQKPTNIMKLRKKRNSTLVTKTISPKTRKTPTSLTVEEIKPKIEDLEPIEEVELNEQVEDTFTNSAPVDDSVNLLAPSSSSPIPPPPTPPPKPKNYTSEASRISDELITSYMRLKCEICEIPVNTFSNLRAHFLSVHKCKGYIHCCGKRFTKRIVLVDHINFHLNPQHFQCKLCFKCLKSRGCLDVHMETTHPKSENLKFECKECDKKFTRQSTLKYHSLKHKTEKNFICKLCEKAFVTQNRLNSHIKSIHENISPYVCDFCGQRFKFKPSFDQHVAAHQGIYEQPVQCHKCHEWLKHKHGLRQHLKRHQKKEVTCKVCSRVCPSQTSLQSHMRYEHMQERNLQCSICDRKFKVKKNLEEHIAMHTGEKHNPCPHCPREFRSKANMYVHIKRDHNEEWMKKKSARSKPQSTQN